MPRGARAKKKNRARQAAEGLGYREARRDRRANPISPSSSAGGSEPAVPAAPTPTNRGVGVSPSDADRLLAQAIDELCGNLQAQELKGADFTSTWGELPLPDGLESPTVGELIPDLSSIDSRPDDTESGAGDGDETHNIDEVPATLFIEGYMPKADALSAADDGLVTILNSDHNRHYAEVAVTTQVEVELSIFATINVATDTVVDVELVDMVLA